MALILLLFPYAHHEKNDVDMPSDHLKLDQIQKWMQFVITHPEGVASGVESPDAKREIPVTPESVERIVTRSKSLTSLERLQIYGNAYYARLVECLGEEYPAVHYAWGADSFDAYAMGYLQKYPSQSYTLGRLGANFPRFLSEVLPGSREETGGTFERFLIELARLERIYSEVFDGPGSEGQPALSSETLGQIPPEAWPGVRLVPEPSLRLETFRSPVHEYITGVRHQESPAIPEPAETYLAIHRREFIVRRSVLSALEYELLSKLMAGLPLGQAIAEALESSEAGFEELASQLQAWFQDWTSRRFFAGVEYGDRLPQKTNQG